MATPLGAQDVQMWLDAYGYKQIGEEVEYKANVGYNTIFIDSAWYKLYWNNAFTWNVKKWYALGGELEFYFEDDLMESSMTELKLQLDQTFTFVQFVEAVNLSKPYLTMKLESRFLWYHNPDSSDRKYRARFRIGGKFIVNKKQLIKHAVYIPFYFESFFNLNGISLERKAEKARGKIGLGYVFSNRISWEVGYLAQLARNTISDDVERTDSVFEFKMRYYFDK